jgi:hypothetical protein
MQWFQTVAACLWPRRRSSSETTMVLHKERWKDTLIFVGSLCGLVHGIMLKRLGHNVTVLEQAPPTFSTIKQMAFGLEGGLRLLCMVRSQQ